MARHEFNCIDGHTCGNPVRLVVDGGPPLVGDSQIARREHFLREFDWIRTGLMFEPRGHDLMSGGFLYPSTRADCDAAVLFIETSGCLPMCGHGTIGIVTLALEHGLIQPRTPGVVFLDTPAGRVEARYTQQGEHIDAVRIVNVPSFLYARDVEVLCPTLGPLRVDIAYGGNFYPILEPQPGYGDLDELAPDQLIRLGRAMTEAIDARCDIRHPLDDRIAGVRHFQWTGMPRHPEAHARNAVIYGRAAIDRSPCGTGTSARMAQLAARGELAVGESFVHESLIGSLFRGRVEAHTTVGGYEAIVPSIEGWARTTGYNRIILDERDPYMHGFQVA